MKHTLSILLLAMACHFGAIGQSLDELLESESAPTKQTVEALFKATRIVNGHSAKQMAAGELDYRISHRFGTLNSGAYEFFGLDQSSIHFSLEYGLFDWLMLGLGRGSYEKTYDGFAKVNFFNQESGQGAFPLTISWLSSVEMMTLKWTDPDRPNYFSSRFSYAHQLLVARKFDRLTLQLMPTMVHRNLVASEMDPNDLWALGIGGRYKLTNRLALTGEYYYVVRPIPQRTEMTWHNPLSLGFDIETGGHVFQIVLTNALGMREGGFIGDTSGSWLKGDIHLGFNISRVFTLY